jgi:hypothetical protein
MFTPEEKMQLFDRLPALELSYEPKLHKKVYSSLYYIIPKGPKALLWYTYWGEENVCLMVMLNERGNYSDIKVFRTVFSDALALGTIIYGTYFIHQDKPYFTCEQLHYYKGVIVSKTKTYLERLNLLLDMFETTQVEQLAYTLDSLIVGLPVMTETYEAALEVMAGLPYKTYGVGCAPASSASPNPHVRGILPAAAKQAAPPPFSKVAIPIKVITIAPVATLPKVFPVKSFTPVGGMAGGGNPTRKAVFNVKAELTADTYSLFSVADNAYVGIAMVPTYKCSVMLNSLFRNIKENTNLDLLEESDDENEFENTQLDKFVDLDKSILMECVFLNKFQKWQPLQKK